MAESNKIPMWKWLEECSFSGYSAVVASVSVGNVPQLSGDLLVTTLDMRRAATLHSAALVPICGADPYRLDSTELCTAADLYVSPAKRTVIVQIRAPLVRRQAPAFLKDVVCSLKEKGVSEIVILSSSFAHENHQVMSSPFRYCTNDLFKRSVDASWIKHDKLVIYGGGFASVLLDVCTENSMPAMILFKYCSEGDNIADAVESVRVLSRVLPLFPGAVDAELERTLKQPVSWRLLYGGPPPLEIY